MITDPLLGKILITGGAGMIGSTVIWELNQCGFSNIMVVDNLGNSEHKWKNLRNLKFAEIIPSGAFYRSLFQKGKDYLTSLGISAIIHLGARSSTTEGNIEFLIENNTNLSNMLINLAGRANIRIVYASSASTYGAMNGLMEDDESTMHQLSPMNGYAFSKQRTDMMVLNYFSPLSLERLNVIGLKYFNVFGPNEYHKKQPSPVLNFYEQYKQNGTIKLFKSDVKDVKDGMQARDFIYSKDAAKMTLEFLFNPKIPGGIYNIGTGKSSTFLKIAGSIVSQSGGVFGMDVIDFVDMPKELVGQYQYNTRAKMDKFIKATGFNMSKLHTIDSAIKDYVDNYLAKGEYLSSRLLTKSTLNETITTV